MKSSCQKFFIVCSGHVTLVRYPQYGGDKYLTDPSDCWSSYTLNNSVDALVPTETPFRQNLSNEALRLLTEVFN